MKSPAQGSRLYQLMVNEHRMCPASDQEIRIKSMVDGGCTDRPKWTRAIVRSMRPHAPLFLAMALVGTVLGGLLVGYEPVGGDPDRLYRPLKSELARASGWAGCRFGAVDSGLVFRSSPRATSRRFIHLIFCSIASLDLSLAYRLSMWLHYVAVVGTTYLYARCLGLSTWGSAWPASHLRFAVSRRSTRAMSPFIV